MACPKKCTLREEEKSLEISTRTAATELSQLKINCFVTCYKVYCILGVIKYMSIDLRGELH